MSCNSEMTLASLLMGMVELPSLPECVISGITEDSRKVAPGYLFLAKNGLTKKGRQHIEQAIDLGAAAILYEAGRASDSDDFSATDVVMVPVANLEKMAGFIVSGFFGAPSELLDIIGVTGTNGKTSCCHFLMQALGHSCAMVGTLGVGNETNLKPTGYTTPDSVALHAFFNDWKHSGGKQVAMEVSSHALAQGRINGAGFCGAVFTNLSPEHLDYHHSMDAYAAQKQKLFQLSSLGFAVINRDDPWAINMQSVLSSATALICFGLGEPKQKIAETEIWASEVETSSTGIRFNLHVGNRNKPLKTQLIGAFNVSNLLAVSGVLHALGWPIERIVEACSRLRPVPGRMQMVPSGPSDPAVIVDYAHTPDALENVLSELGQQVTGRLFCVFGCGGNRDREKRPMMASIAEKYCHQVYLTDDNPRFESGELIIKDILKGFKAPRKARVIRDRKAVIQRVIQQASAGDIVLIAGKGHETGQLVEGAVLPFSDEEEARKALRQVVSA